MLGTGDTRSFLPGGSIRQVSDPESVSLHLTIKSQEEVGLGRDVPGATKVFGLDSGLQLRCPSPSSRPARCLGPATAFRLYCTLSVCVCVWGTAKFEFLTEEGGGGQPLLQRVAHPLGSQGGGGPCLFWMREISSPGQCWPRKSSPCSPVCQSLVPHLAGRAGLTTFLGGPAQLTCL